MKDIGHHLGATSDGIKLAKVCGNTKYSRGSYPSSSNVITMQFISGPLGNWSRFSSSYWSRYSPKNLQFFFINNQHCHETKELIVSRSTNRGTRGALILLKFWQFSSELTKTWSSGATECRVWIGNCNVKVWKSTVHKFHKIWRSLKFCTNWGKRAHPWEPTKMTVFSKLAQASPKHTTGLVAICVCTIMFFLFGFGIVWLDELTEFN